MRQLLLLPLLLLSTGCGIAVQSIVGWNDLRPARVTRDHSLTINSKPAGASVARIQGAETLSLGVTPYVDAVEYRAEHTVAHPKYWGLLGTGIGEMVVGAILAGASRSAQSDCPGSFADEVEACSNGTANGLVGSGGVLMTFGAVDVVWGLVRLFQKPVVTKTVILDDPKVDYVLTLDGKEKTATLPIPKAEAVTIDMASGGLAIVEESPVLPPPVEEIEAVIEPPGLVIAVMNVEDANVGTDLAIDAGLVRNLSDQLRIYVAQNGARTIDRTTQDRTFKERMSQMKNETYDACYDDSCQIDLGKALAASHILRSRITKFGSRCVLNGELIDLAQEVTIKAASARGDCRDEGFLEMSEAIAKDLASPEGAQ